VAVVVGDDPYLVADALEDVVVEYDPLFVVVDPEAALQDNSPLVHEQFGSCVQRRLESGAVSAVGQPAEPGRPLHGGSILLSVLAERVRRLRRWLRRGGS
jgi:CO/xanthine dehydrogenase Mo-binding subunit